MRLVRIWLLGAAAVFLFPYGAHAVQVSITYDLGFSATCPAGCVTNDTNLLGGALPTGGTATVIWNMTSLNGLFLDPPGFQSAQIVELVLSNAFGELALAPAPAIDPNQFASLDGTFGQLFIDSGAGGLTTPGVESAFAAARVTSAGLFVDFVAGFDSNTGTLLSQACGTEITCQFLAQGQEVAGSRTLVPEPSTALFLVLGLAGLAGVGRRRDPAQPA